MDNPMSSSIGSTYSLEGQVALVTGASSGIGPYIARRLDEQGARLVLHYHQNEKGVRSVQDALSNDSLALRADLGDETAAEDMMKRALEHFGQLSILVNCAAEQTLFPLAAMTMEQWSSMQKTNVDAVFLLSQLFVRQADVASIVNISSIEGSRPARGHGHYSTSKAALEMLTRACALEFGERGVRINAVAPGLIRRPDIETDWPEGVASWCAAAPLGRLGEPDDIADAVLFLCSKASKFITGTVLTVDGGMSIQPGW